MSGHVEYQSLTQQHLPKHSNMTWCNNILHIIIIIGIQSLGHFGQRPEPSQGTGTALVRCILGKFLGTGCHYFPSLFRCSHFPHQVPQRLSWRERSYITCIMLKCYQRSKTNFLAKSVVTTSVYLILKGQIEPITSTHNYWKKQQNHSSRSQLNLQDCREGHK
jgi:hypothetical protein